MAGKIKMDVKKEIKMQIGEFIKEMETAAGYPLFHTAYVSESGRFILSLYKENETPGKGLCFPLSAGSGCMELYFNRCRKKLPDGVAAWAKAHCPNGKPVKLTFGTQKPAYETMVKHRAVWLGETLNEKIETGCESGEIQDVYKRLGKAVRLFMAIHDMP